MSAQIYKKKKVRTIISRSMVLLGIVFLMSAMFTLQSSLNVPTASAVGNLTPGRSEALVNGVFPQNNITGWNPLECITKGGATSNSCFKIDSSVDAHDFWYAEGCLSKCKSSSYAHTVYDSENPFLRDDTESDEELGGLLYIYAENYDIDYDTGYGKFNKNGGNSTQKYYWVVLPDQAYSNGFGETYVATFENVNKPIYFITFDVHACPHQSEDYCGKADADPDGVQAGREFLGAISDTGSPTEAANILGKLTSLCRINGRGEVTASHNASNAPASTSGNTKSSSTSSTSGTSSASKTSSDSNQPSGDKITWIGDSYSVAAHSIIEEKLPGISFGSGIENSGSYIQSNKGVSDRYGGGDANPPALTILKRLADSGELKPYLVMAVGTNMGWDDNEVNTFNSIMSSHPDTKVVFVTAKAKARLSAETDGTNERLKALADSNDNYYLADWAAAYDDSYFANNSTHPDANGGYAKWVEVIVNALNQLGGDCVEGNSDVLSSVESIIELANKNGSTYTWGGGHTSDSGTFDAMLNGSPINVDCTGFASLVMYKTYGEMTSFTSYSIFNDPLYKEIDRADVQPGDIFAYNSPSGHGGIVIEASNGVVTKIAETGGSEGASGSNNNIGYSGPDSFSVQNMNGENGHFFRWNGPNNGSKGTSESCGYCDAEKDSIHSGGFKDVEEADSVIMAPYRELYDHPELWGEYNLAGGPDNCVSFSKYFITKYTSIDYHGEAFGDGGALAQGFYDSFHGSYPDLTISDKPSAYSIASCGDAVYVGGNYSHTFVVLGVDESSDKMIIGEAGYGSGIGFTTAKEFSLTDPSSGSHNGVGVPCTYVNINKYITGL